ncbi:MAG TPA: hypothetical protein VFH67_00095 [bacterium]|nr:hypothetical protein [bacterium]
MKQDRLAREAALVPPLSVPASIHRCTDSVARDETGIGLLEILFVIMLLGLTTVVALPQLERYMTARDVTHSARQLGGDVRATQQFAITQDERFRLVYTAVPSPAYTIQKSSDGSVVRQADLPVTITVTGSFATTPVEFTPTGAPVASGEFCLTNGTLIRRIDVRPATGRISVSEVSACP